MIPAMIRREMSSNLSRKRGMYHPFVLSSLLRCAREEDLPVRVPSTSTPKTTPTISKASRWLSELSFSEKAEGTDSSNLLLLS